MRETEENTRDFQEVPEQKRDSKASEREIVDKIFLDGGEHRKYNEDNPKRKWRFLRWKKRRHMKRTKRKSGSQ